MKKVDILVIIFLFIFWIIIFPLIFTRILGFKVSTAKDVLNIVGNEILAMIGSIGFYLILMKVIRKKANP